MVSMAFLIRLYHSSRLQLLLRKFLTLLWQDANTCFLADPPQVRELTKDIRAEHQTHSKNRVEAQHAIVDSIASFIHKWDSKGLGWMGCGIQWAQGFVGMKFQLVGHLKFPPKNQQQLSKIFLLAGTPHLPSFALYFQRSNAALTRMNWQGTRPCKAKRTCRDRVRMYDRPNLSKLCLWETSTFLIAFVPGNREQLERDVSLQNVYKQYIKWAMVKTLWPKMLGCAAKQWALNTWNLKPFHFVAPGNCALDHVSEVSMCRDCKAITDSAAW